MTKIHKIRKLTFVRDLKIDELINLIAFMYSNNSYNNRSNLVSLLLKKRRIIFPLRRSVSYKSASNSLITLANLDLIDANGKLNYRGKYLAKTLKLDKKTFLGYLSYILLFEGNWICLIKAIEKIEKQDKNSLKFMREVVRMLVENSNLNPGINIRDMAIRIRGNNINWLKFLRIIDIKKESLIVNSALIKEIKTKFKIPPQN